MWLLSAPVCFSFKGRTTSNPEGVLSILVIVTLQGNMYGSLLINISLIATDKLIYDDQKFICTVKITK